MLGRNVELAYVVLKKYVWSAGSKLYFQLTNALCHDSLPGSSKRRARFRILDLFDSKYHVVGGKRFAVVPVYAVTQANCPDKVVVCQGYLVRYIVKIAIGERHHILVHDALREYRIYKRRLAHHTFFIGSAKAGNNRSVRQK